MYADGLSKNEALSDPDENNIKYYRAVIAHGKTVGIELEKGKPESLDNLKKLEEYITQSLKVKTFILFLMYSFLIITVILYVYNQ